MTPPAPPAKPAPAGGDLVTRLGEAARLLDRSFLDKQEIVRLLLVSVVAGEHMVLIGPPGTAKSAIISLFARLVDARYFEYLLTRFTEPNEIFGPVDILRFREGSYGRRTEGMLPESEIVFLDEIFKSNSAILNSLLTILNERKFQSGAERKKVPLLSLFAASNEVPNDESLTALFDRFLLRVISNNLDSYHFHGLLQRGIENEIGRITGRVEEIPALVSAAELHQLGRTFDQHLKFSDEFLAKYKGLVFQIRSEGVSLSDRRVVKLTKLFAASAYLERRQPCDADFFILRHIWNNLDQAEILADIVNPVVDAYHRANPKAPRLLGPSAKLDDLLAELGLIRDVLRGGAELSDIQIFSQLKNLGEIRAALARQGGETATRMIAEVDQLLETVFAGSRFGG